MYYLHLTCNYLQVNLVRIEMSTLQSACNRDVAELKEQLNGVLRNNELDRTMREKVLNDAKVEVLALNEKVSGHVSLRKLPQVIKRYPFS